MPRAASCGLLPWRATNRGCQAERPEELRTGQDGQSYKQVCGGRCCPGPGLTLPGALIRVSWPLLPSHHQRSTDPGALPLSPSGHNKLQHCAAAGFSPPSCHLSTVMYVPCLFPQECEVTGVSWVGAAGGRGQCNSPQALALQVNSHICSVCNKCLNSTFVLKLHQCTRVFCSLL